MSELPVMKKKAVKKVSKKKTVKKGKSKEELDVIAKVKANKKAHAVMKKEQAKRAKDQAKVQKAMDSMELDFHAFCKKHNVKAVTFIGLDSLGITAELQSKGLKSYERTGLVELNK